MSEALNDAWEHLSNAYYALNDAKQLAEDEYISADIQMIMSRIAEQQKAIAELQRR